MTGTALVRTLRTPVRGRLVGRAALASRPPNGPGCSRWLTCTCCRSDTRRSGDNAEFFSSQRRPSPPTVERAPKRSAPELAVSTLPLPPRLPYSPTSRPFQRHLEALSLSFFSSPDNSWDVYVSLDPSLRRYIPDAIFKDLVAHQLSHEDVERRGSRASHLMSLAKDCSMPLDAFGRDILEQALESIARYLPKVKKGSRRATRILLDDMLRILERGGLSSISAAARTAWADILFNPISRLSAAGNAINMSTLEDVLSSLRRFIASGGLVGLHDHLESKLLLVRSIRFAPTIFEFHCFCWTHDLDTRVDTALRILYRLHDASSRIDDPIRLLERARQSYSTTALARSNFDTLAHGLAEYHKTPSERAAAVNDDTPVNTILRLALAILDRERDSERLELVVRLCEQALRSSDTRCRPLISKIIPAIASHDNAALAKSFVKIVLARGEPQKLFSASLAQLVRLSARHVPEDLYTVYSLARSSEKSYTWSRSNRHIWKDLFRISLESGRIAHVSRLYSDLIADGMSVHREETLAALRSLAGRPPTGLIERLISDHLMKGESRTTLVDALAQGAGDNAAEILALSRRILPELPVGVAAIFARKLVKSDLTTSRQILLSISTEEPIAINLYNGILTAYSRISRTPLAPILDVCREMALRGIRPNSRTVSILVRALLGVGRLDDALLLFQLSLSHGVSLKSAVTGRLMIQLAMARRLPEADEVERQWRSITAAGWDKGVVGARMLVDTMRGEDVDISAVKKLTGWSPNKHFAAFIALHKDSSHVPEPREADVKEEFDVRSLWPDSFRRSPERDDVGEERVYRMAVA